jgi:holo-[acyl-carrier protein] synthase
MKALGTGWSNGVGWQNFEVRLDPRGRPHLHVTGRLHQRTIERKRRQ